jgi:hypothetical protein
MIYTKTALVAFSLLAHGVLGNIKFPTPIISCTPPDVKCLEGQVCGDDSHCRYRSPGELFRRVARPAPIPAPGDFSTDGRCGPAFGGLICNPASPNYAGGCCSVSPLYFTSICSGAY